MIPLRYKLVYCQWYDATDIGDGWTSYEDLMEDDTNSTVHQVGYQTKETDEYIILSGSVILGDTQKEDHIGNSTRIPKKMIKQLIEW